MVGTISGFLISTPFVVLMVDGDWKTIFGLFIISLGFGALLIAITIAGGFGYFIHQMNAKTHNTKVSETI